MDESIRAKTTVQVTVEELKTLYTDWKTAREKPVKNKTVAV